MPFDEERKPIPLSTEELEWLEAATGATCAGIPQCSIRKKDFRRGMCHIDGCPREETARLAAKAS
ncbi:MAG: hypothetical protein HY473_01715 [Candidatus Sungbacteria bacterium]|uniref:Uncharacterized protein n=1 Tax=Candidatus Sungiibacteriota bacterium TaxID=2750080 RepID=A0A932YZ11_9BACT|nr:hypothetical protein [Candidatus Sungbacteria bacterium]